MKLIWNNIIMQKILSVQAQCHPGKMMIPSIAWKANHLSGISGEINGSRILTLTTKAEPWVRVSSGMTIQI